MREIKQGDRWFQTRDTGLAAVLTALDFEFFGTEAPCQIREVKGERIAHWCYEASAGKLEAGKVLKAWKNADKYCEENPSCPIASAVSAVKNLRVFNEGIKTGTAMVGYKMGKRVIWIAEGSDKENKIIKDGRAKKL